MAEVFVIAHLGSADQLAVCMAPEMA